jgi:integrase
VPLEYKLPIGSMAALLAYRKRFRPLLSSGPTSALFPGRRRGRTKRSDTLSHQINALIKNEVGIEWTPHAFRHLSVRINMRAHPGDYETPRRLLGHVLSGP